MNNFQTTNTVEIFLLNDNMHPLGFSCRKVQHSSRDRQWSIQGGPWAVHPNSHGLGLSLLATCVLNLTHLSSASLSIMYE